MKIFVSLLLLVSCVSADFLSLRNIHEKYQEQVLEEKPRFIRQFYSSGTVAQLFQSGAAVDTKFFSQQIDHFDASDDKTFKQRYHVNSIYYKAGGPVLLYVGGESELRQSAVTRGAIVNLAMEHNALVLGLEHRYYGVSHPFELLSTKNMKYL